MPGVDGGLQPYLWEPDPAQEPSVARLVDLARHEWVKAGGAGRSRPAPWTATSTLAARPGRMAPHFARTVPLSRQLLAAGMQSWWAGGARAGAITVQRRLRLGRPTGDADSGWTMRGRVRRLTRWHWIPVVVEIWPLYDGFARMTMTPQSHVFASRRYFRLGNVALDRLCTVLSGIRPDT